LRISGGRERKESVDSEVEDCGVLVEDICGNGRSGRYSCGEESSCGGNGIERNVQAIFGDGSVVFPALMSMLSFD
jgi:hypothetical protein